MEETGPSLFDIYESEWVEEVKKLAAKSGDKALCVQVRWSFGDLIANGFLPQVNDRTLQILLQPQLHGSLHDGVARISLPKLEGTYRKQENESGEIILTMFYPLGTTLDWIDWAEIQIATNWDFLYLVNSKAHVQ